MKLVRLIKMCLSETYSRVQVRQNLSDTFLIGNGLIKGDALSLLLFNFALDYAFRRVQVNQACLKLTDAQQLLVYAADVNILGGNVHTLKKNAEALVVASKEIGLEENALLCLKYNRGDQNKGRSHSIKINNISFKSGIVQIIGNNLNRSKFYPGRN